MKERVSEKQSNPGREKIKCGNGLMAQISPNKVDFQRVTENKRNKQLMFKEPSVARVVLTFFQTISGFSSHRLVPAIRRKSHFFLIAWLCGSQCHAKRKRKVEINKSCLRDTPNLSADADSSTNILVSVGIKKGAAIIFSLSFFAQKKKFTPSPTKKILKVNTFYSRVLFTL